MSYDYLQFPVEIPQFDEDFSVRVFVDPDALCEITRISIFTSDPDLVCDQASDRNMNVNTVVAQFPIEVYHNSHGRGGVNLNAINDILCTRLSLFAPLVHGSIDDGEDIVHTLRIYGYKRRGYTIEPLVDICPRVMRLAYPGGSGVLLSFVTTCIEELVNCLQEYPLEVDICEWLTSEPLYGFVPQSGRLSDISMSSDIGSVHEWVFDAVDEAFQSQSAALDGSVGNVDSGDEFDSDTDSDMSYDNAADQLASLDRALERVVGRNSDVMPPAVPRVFIDAFTAHNMQVLPFISVINEHACVLELFMRGYPEEDYLRRVGLLSFAQFVRDNYPEFRQAMVFGDAVDLNLRLGDTVLIPQNARIVSVFQPQSGVIDSHTFDDDALREFVAKPEDDGLIHDEIPGNIFQPESHGPEPFHPNPYSECRTSAPPGVDFWTKVRMVWCMAWIAMFLSRICPEFSGGWREFFQVLGQIGWWFMFTIPYNCWVTWSTYRESWRIARILKAFNMIKAAKSLAFLDKASASTRLFVVEVKAFMHSLYHVLNGNPKRALEHTSYLLFTRSLGLDTVMLNAGLFGWSCLRDAGVMKVDGKDVVVDGDTYDELCRKADSGVEIKLDDVTPHVELQNGNLEVLASNLGSWLANWKIPCLSVKELETANKQYAFIRSTQKDVSDKSALMLLVIRLALRTKYCYDPLEAAFQLFSGDTVDLIKKIDEYYARKNQLCASKELQLEILEIYDICRRLSLHPRMASMPPFITKRFYPAFDRLTELRVMAEQFLKGSKHRPEPVCVLFMGTPGAGKSPCTQFLMNALSVIDGEVYNTSQTYVLGDSQYWENYQGQKYAYADDFFKSTQQTVLLEEASRVINMVNTAPYNLNMAFEGKGYTFFDSKYVFLSTNYGINDGYCSTIWNVGLKDPNALKKRFHLVVERFAKASKDIVDDKFLIVKCDDFPEWEGLQVTPSVLTLVVRAMRQSRDEKFHDNAFTYAGVWAELERNGIPCRDVDSTPTLEKAEEPGFKTANYVELLRNKYTVIMSAHPAPMRYQSQGKHTETGTCPSCARKSHRGFTKQAGPLFDDDRKPPDPVEWLLKVLPMQLMDWCESPYAIPFAIAFAVLVLLATTPWLLDQFVGTFEAQSPPPPSFKEEQQLKHYNARGVRIKKGSRGKADSSDILGMRYNCAPIPDVVPQRATMDFIASLRETIARGTVMFELIPRDGSSKGEFSHGFHARDGIIVGTAHGLVPYSEEGMEVDMVIHVNGKSHTCRLPQVYQIEGEDIAFFVLPKEIPMPPALYKYLIESHSMNDISPTAEVFHIGIGFHEEVIIRSLTRVPFTGVVKYECANEVLLLQDLVSYLGDCELGHSGRPAIINSHGGPKIIGIHVGVLTRGRKIGLANILCKEWFDEAISSMATQSSALPVKIDRVVPLNEAHNLPQRTRIRPSYMHGFQGPPECIPARFLPFEDANGKIVDPLVVSLGKMRQVAMEEPTCDLTRARDYVLNKYPPIDNPRNFTKEQALNGIPEEGIPSINVSTSPGYPYEHGATRGKAPYVTRGSDGKLVFQQEFEQKLDLMHDQLKRGEQIPVMWADSMKDETRPVAKVMQGKTRIFTSCPLHYLILLRMYTLEFTSYVQRLAATHFSSVGLNYHSLQWNVLYARLARHSGSVISGDYTNFDGTIPTFVGKTVLEVVNTWYGNDVGGNAIRALLFEHLWNSERICKEFVYKTRDGNPSGNPFTSIFNTFANAIILTTVFLCFMNMSEDDFEMALYGDDNVVTMRAVGVRCSDIAPHIKQLFNMDYTHWSKAVGADPLDTLDTIRYLGRKFVRIGGFMRAPLDMRSIVECMYWTRGSDNSDIAFMSTVLAAFLELSHFEQEVYDNNVKYILKVVKERCPAHVHDYLVRVKKTYWGFIDMFYDQSKRRIEPLYQRYMTREMDVEVSETFQVQSGSLNRSTAESYTTVVDSDHTEYTTRAANEANTAQEVQLGAYQDVAPVVSGASSDLFLQDPHKTCNMETFDLDRVMNREYEIASYLWNTSQTVNTVIAAMKFPSLLFNQAFIAEKIDNFRWFRAAIRLTVRCISNPFLYGKCILSYTPGYVNASSASSYTGYAQYSGLPHVLISASSGAVVVFDVPFIHPWRALDLTSYQSDEMGTFTLSVLNSLTDVNGEVSTARILVTAQFVESQLFMPHSDIAASFQLQSGNTSEAKKKSMNQSVSNSFVSNQSINSMVKAAQFVSQYAISTAARAMIGLSKPRTTDAVKMIKANPYSDINTGSGVDFNTSLGFDPDNQISTVPNVAGMHVDEMDFKQLCGTPSMYALHTGTPTTVGLFIIPTRFQGMVWSATSGSYPDFLCSFFDYVSGSRKVKLYITASVFHSVRMVFYLSDGASATEWQNCYHRVVDIQGDTEVEFTLPYCDGPIVQYTDGAAETGGFGLYATTLSWSQPIDSVVSNVYINVYASAADDFQVGGFVQNEFTKQSCPRQDFTRAFEPFHQSMSSFQHEGFVFGEKYTTVRQMVHKYQAIKDVGSNAQYVYAGTGNASTNVYLGLECFGLMYAFWRGSVRIKALTNSGNRMVLLVSNTATQSILVGAGISVPNNNPLAELDVPYYDRNLYQRTKDNSKLTYASGVAAQHAFILKAAGDDFSFHFIQPPPLGAFTYTNTNGFDGLRNDNV